MDVNDTITLDDGRKYTLLCKIDEGDNSFFLAIGLDEAGEPDYTDMLILQEFEEIDGIYVEPVTEIDQITRLSELFQKQLSSEDDI